MIVLGVTTSDEQCGIALRYDGEPAGSDTFPGMRSCVEELIPRIDRLLSSNGLLLSEIDRFGVDAGPGGLAGIKIGLSAVKTLAQVTDKPAAAVSSLYAMSLAASRAEPGAELFLPIVNCTKVEFYCALFRRLPGGGVELAADERLAGADGLRAMLRQWGQAGKVENSDTLLDSAGGGGSVLAFGSAAGRMRGVVEEALGSRVSFAPPELNRPNAEIICEIAETAEALPFDRVMPNYLCLTQAERDRGISA